MGDLNYRLVITALDKGASGTIHKLSQGVRTLNGNIRAAPAGWVATKTAMDRTTSAAQRFNEAGRAGGRVLDDLIDRQRRLRREAQQTEQRYGSFLDVLSGRPSESWAALASRGLGLGATAGAAVGAGSVAGGFGFLRRVMDTGGRFESYQTQLSSMDGAASARQSVNWVERFAAQTPYDVEQVMESFIRLRSSGIEPTNGALRSLGDAASTKGKTLLSAVEMLSDAQMGEFERLKEFSITAQQQGQRVSFTYTKAGRDITVVSQKSATAIRRTLLGIFDSQFQGAMAAQSRTWIGMTSAMSDHWVKFLRRVADGGVFDSAKDELGGFLRFLDQAEKRGDLTLWAKEVSGSLTQLVKTGSALAREVNWLQLGKDINTVASAVLALARAGNQMSQVFSGQAFNADVSWGPNDLYHKAFGRRADTGKSRVSGFMDFVGNPMAYDSAGRVRGRRAFAAPARPTLSGARLPGLPGGPAWQAGPVTQQLRGQIQIGLAPGLELKRADFGPGIDYRRGRVGDRE